MMLSVKAGSIPENGLLMAYADTAGCYTDCFVAEVVGPVGLADLISAFFNTPVFRLERKLLGWFAKSPSRDADVSRLASGVGDSLAMWKVEARGDDQVLMAVGKGPIRTWLMVGPVQPTNVSRLYFGSAVLPVIDPPGGKPKIGKMFRLFLGFHMFYSRILLWAAVARLRNSKGKAVL